MSFLVRKVIFADVEINITIYKYTPSILLVLLVLETHLLCQYFLLNQFTKIISLRVSFMFNVISTNQ